MNSIYKIGNGYTVETINEENYQEKGSKTIKFLTPLIIIPKL